MAKIKIAQNPTFTAVVQVPRIGGEPVPVEFQFRYMDRVTLAGMFDRWNKARETWAEKAQKDGASWEEVTAGEITLQAEQLGRPYPEPLLPGAGQGRVGDALDRLHRL
ncbi:MAG: hypothetical protein H5U33_11635, partial [Pseudomonas sp.]|nr:hypothetical protein [Pseudomonas sp.]